MYSVSMFWAFCKGLKFLYLINIWALFPECISHICPFLNIISILQLHRGPALDVSLCLKFFNLLFFNQVLKSPYFLFWPYSVSESIKELQFVSHFRHWMMLGLWLFIPYRSWLPLRRESKMKMTELLPLKVYIHHK